jgi:hypothetical protein
MHCYEINNGKENIRHEDVDENLKEISKTKTYSHGRYGCRCNEDH